MDPLLGQSIGRYRILERIGAGGMAVVYKAEDTHIHAAVAMKFIQPGIRQEEKFLRRFEREAHTLARLTHPNIVRTSDFGVWEGMPYFVMTYVGGGTLKERMSAPVGAYEAAQLLIPVALALHAAHREGIIHRDVKPSNILMTEGGDPLLSDFGVARLADNEEHTQLTSTGMGVGTPDYMAPEQWENKAGPAADQYALGVMFFEMVTGRKPFAADTPVAVMRRHVLEAVPSARQLVPGLPREVDAIINRALAKQPEKRYPDMAALAEALRGVPKPKIAPVKAPRTAPVRATPTPPAKTPAPRAKTPTPKPATAGSLFGRAKEKTPPPAPVTPSQEMETSEVLSGERVSPVKPPPRRRPWPWIGLGGLAMAVVLAALLLPGWLGKNAPGAVTPAVPPTRLAGADKQPPGAQTQAPGAQTQAPGAQTQAPATVAAQPPTAAPTLETSALAPTAVPVSDVPVNLSDLGPFDLSLAAQEIGASNLAQVRVLGTADLPSGVPIGSPAGLAFAREEWSRQPRYLITTRVGEKTNLWDLEQGRPGEYLVGVNGAAQAVLVITGSVGPVTSGVVASLKDGELYLVDQATGKMLMNTRVPDWPAGETPFLRLLSDGKRLAVGAGMKGWIYSLPALQVTRSLDFSEPWQAYIQQDLQKPAYQAYYKDHLPTVRDCDATGREWLLDATGFDTGETAWTVYSESPRAAVFSPNGSFTAVPDGVWRGAGQKIGPADLYEHIVFSADGTLIVSYAGSRLRLTVTGSPDQAVELPQTETPVVGLAWSLDGKYFAAQEQNGRIVFYGVPWPAIPAASERPVPAGPAAVKSLPKPSAPALSAANAAQAALTLQLKTSYADPVTSLAFSPDGKLVAAGTGSGLVLVWSVNDGQLIYRLAGHHAAVRALAFSNSGALLASGGDDNLMIAWEMDTGIEAMRGGADRPTFLKFLQSDQMLAIGGYQNGVLVKVMRYQPGLWNSFTYDLRQMRNAFLKSLPSDQIGSEFQDIPLHVDDVSPDGKVWYADGMSFNMESKAVIGFQDEYSYRSETDRSRAFMTKDHLHVLTPQALYLLTGQKERDLPTGPLAAVAWDASPLVAYRGPQGARLGSLEDAAAAAGAAFGVDLPGGPAMPTTLDFSNDGQHVAAGDLVGNVFVWAVP